MAGIFNCFIHRYVSSLEQWPTGSTSYIFVEWVINNILRLMKTLQKQCQQPLIMHTK